MNYGKYEFTENSESSHWEHYIPCSNLYILHHEKTSAM